MSNIVADGCRHGCNAQLARCIVRRHLTPFTGVATGTEQLREISTHRNALCKQCARAPIVREQPVAFLHRQRGCYCDSLLTFGCGIDRNLSLPMQRDDTHFKQSCLNECAVDLLGQHEVESMPSNSDLISRTVVELAAL